MFDVLHVFNNVCKLVHSFKIITVLVSRILVTTRACSLYVQENFGKQNNLTNIHKVQHTSVVISVKFRKISQYIAVGEKILNC